MAKLTRESRLRERRFEKQARKDARKLAASDPDAHTDNGIGEFEDGPPAESENGAPAEFEDAPAAPAAEQPAKSV